VDLGRAAPERLGYLARMQSAQKGRASRIGGRSRRFLRGLVRKPLSRARTVMFCDLCELTGGPFAPGEAAHLLEIHVQLHHGGVSRHRSALPPSV
jgi:hypothetical protein